MNVVPSADKRVAGTLLVVVATVLALGGCGSASVPQLSETPASSLPSPTSSGGYPVNPITERVPTVFELTEPLPAALEAIDTMDADTEFAALPAEDKLTYLSWLTQRQPDYNARFTTINIDVPEAANLNSEPSPDDSALLILQRYSMVVNSSLSFADWTRGENPPPIDLNRAKKIVYALYWGSRADSPPLEAALEALEGAAHSFDVDTLASASRGVCDPNDIVSKSAPYDTDDGYVGVDIMIRDSVDGHEFRVTYIFVPFVDFRGEPHTAVVFRSPDSPT